MKTNSIAIFASACIAVCYGQPVVNSGGVLHAGSYERNIAQGSMLVIFGSGLGPAQLVQASAYPLSTTLAGTSVAISVGGQTWPAPIVYTSAGQVGAIMPTAAGVGSGTVAVTFNGQASSAAEVRIVKSAFGAFTANARGTGTAVIQNFVSAADQPRNDLAASAASGQVVTLWGTGLGPVAGSDDAPAAGSIVDGVQVLVGGKAAKVLYAGRSGCCAGVDQIAFEIPADVEGCYVSIEVRVGGVASTQNMTLAVAPKGGACTESIFLRSEDLDRARTQGSLKVGSLLLIRYSYGDTQSFDYGFLSFSEASYTQLAQTSRNLAAAAPGACEAASYDMNSVTEIGKIGTIGADFYTNLLFWGTDKPLEAGDKVTVAGNGKSLSFNKMVPGMYSNFAYDPSNPNSFGGFLSPGNYTIDNGSGGQHVPGFRTNVTVPQTPRFAGGMDVSIPRSRDYTIRWTGGAQNERVLISGWSYSLNPFAMGVFTCVGRANSNSFTVPSSILSLMPASGSLTQGQGYGFLSIYSFAPFQRSTVSGLDAFYSGVMNLSYQTAQFQ